MNYPLHRIKLALATKLKRFGKYRFISALPQSARLLDVGCGNNSPLYTKLLRPDIYYIGLDVGDYKQHSGVTSLCDEYAVTKSADFDQAIAKADAVDALISSHNLEHCDQPQKVLTAMSDVIQPGGLLYMAFPCEASVQFPHRYGTLNFYDDPTHKQPIALGPLLEALKQKFEILFLSARYRPTVLLSVGVAVEPISAITRRVLPGTWALYGFETVIWGRKRQR